MDAALKWTPQEMYTAVKVPLNWYDYNRPKRVKGDGEMADIEGGESRVTAQKVVDMLKLVIETYGDLPLVVGEALVGQATNFPKPEVTVEWTQSFYPKGPVDGTRTQKVVRIK